MIGLLTSSLAGCLAEPTAAGDKGELPIHRSAFADYGRLAPITDAFALDDAALEHELELRASWGLTTDRELVRAMHADPTKYGVQRSGVDMFGNMPLAEFEIAAAVERAELEYHGPAVDEWAATALADGYAGSFLEGGKVVVLCSSCDTRSVESTFAAENTNEVLRGRIEVRRVPHSLAALAAREDRLAKALGARGLTTNASMVDVLQNRVIVYAGPSTAAQIYDALPQLERMAGGAIEVVESDSEPSLDVNKDVALGYALVEGGQKITSGGGCTSGFAVQNGYGPFMLTAGHCVEGTKTWYQGGAVLGVASTWQNSGSMDAGAITTHGYRNNWGRIHNTTKDDAHPVTFGVTTHNLLNQTVCQTGYVTTGLDGLQNSSARCGTVTSVSYRPNAAFNATFGSATYMRNHGDSGAGVYWPTAYGFGAAGLHSRSVNESKTPGIFTRYSVVASAWGLSLSAY